MMLSQVPGHPLVPYVGPARSPFGAKDINKARHKDEETNLPHRVMSNTIY